MIYQNMIKSTEQMQIALPFLGDLIYGKGLKSVKISTIGRKAFLDNR